MIKRTITSTTVNYKIIKADENGELQATDHTKVFAGSTSKDKASRSLKKELKDKPFLITSLESTTARYEISIEDFIAAATLIPNEQSEVE